MQNLLANTYFHADDFGITAKQARDILSLSSACNGTGALNSLSIFANSPIFPESSALLLPFSNNEEIRICLHLNLVEGPCVSEPTRIPLLVNKQGMFRRDFLGLLALNRGIHRTEARAQIALECQNQIRKFINAFPATREQICIDSHQHTHAIPLVFEALSQALAEEGCLVRTLRAPLDPLTVYRAAQTQAGKAAVDEGPSEGRASVPLSNRAKVFLIDLLWKKCPINAVPWECNASKIAPLFCGVALSGAMHRFNPSLLEAFEVEAARQHRPLEILFHPVSVPLTECLDPQNKPFAQACASSNRDGEALVLKRIPLWS